MEKTINGLLKYIESEKDKALAAFENSVKNGTSATCEFFGNRYHALESCRVIIGDYLKSSED